MAECSILCDSCVSDRVCMHSQFLRNMCESMNVKIKDTIEDSEEFSGNSLITFNPVNFNCSAYYQKR